MFLKHFFLSSRIGNNRGQAGAAPADVSDATDDKTGNKSSQVKLSGILSDIDVSDVPEEIRSEVVKHLEKKVKNYDSGFQSKAADLARERKELEEQRYKVRDLIRLQEEVHSNPDLKDEIENVITQARAGNLKRKDVNSSTDKMLDKLIANAPDAETREQLNLLRNVVKEEVKDLVSLKDQYAGILKKVESIENVTKISQGERVESKINSLKERFGKEIVDKHQEDLRKLAAQYPNMAAEKLFYFTASDEELSSAFVNEQKRKLELEEKRKAEGSFGAARGIKKPIELSKDKFGRTNFRDLAQKFFAKSTS